MLGRLLTRWLVLVTVVTLFIFSARFTVFNYHGYTFPLPTTAGDSYAVTAFTHLAHVLTPAGVPLVVVSPSAAFAALVLVAFLLGMAVTLPILLWQLVRYLAPALTQVERQNLRWFSAALLVLLAAGGYFSYAVVSPFTIRILYTFTEPIGVEPLLGVSELIATFLALTITTAVAFTVPVAMVLLTKIGLLSAAWWRQQSRYAVLGFLIVSAIITPDGTGVSMLLLAAPVTVLYGAGALVCGRLEQRTQINE